MCGGVRGGGGYEGGGGAALQGGRGVRGGRGGEREVVVVVVCEWGGAGEVAAKVQFCR